MVSASQKPTVGARCPRTVASYASHPSLPSGFQQARQFPWQPHQGPGGPTGRAVNEQNPRTEASPAQATSGHLLVGLGTRILETWVGCLRTKPHQVASHKSDKSHVLAGPQFPSLCHGNSPSSRLPLLGCQVGQRG